MAKTAISTLITAIKRKSDYNISDEDLDNFIIDEINDALKLTKQWLMDEGLFKECSDTASIKTVENQEYLDIANARIVGDVSTFTGIANDKIKVTINGVDYDNISIAAATTIALVASAINTAVGSTVASVSDNGYLVITSPTSGASSSVTIADGSTTGQTVVGDLFSVSAERTQSAIADVDEIIFISERNNDKPITQISFDELRGFYPDPTASYTMSPDYFSVFDNRLYFGPTPDDNILIYIDFIFEITEVTSTSTCPFKNKYDPLIKALCVKGLADFLEPDNANRVASANRNVEFYKKELITGASRNISMRKGTASRKPEIPYFAPRKVID